MPAGCGEFGASNKRKKLTNTRAILTICQVIQGISSNSTRYLSMDTLDHQLLALLRENARTPVATLARALRVSRGTIQNRIDRLLADGVLLGFTVRTSAEGTAHRIRAVTLIRTEGDAELVLRAVRGYPAVRALHTTNGRWDIVAELATDTLEQFDEVLRQIGKVRGVANTETSLLLSTHKL
jgi:DNA-binding Lrp family transcriptional regulator